MGHGWVIPNEDGSVAKCGGPKICRTCQHEMSVLAEQRVPEIMAMIGERWPEVLAETLTETREQRDADDAAIIAAALNVCLHPYFSDVGGEERRNTPRCGVVIETKRVLQNSARSARAAWQYITVNDGKIMITDMKPNEYLPHGSVIRIPAQIELL